MLIFSSWLLGLILSPGFLKVSTLFTQSITGFVFFNQGIPNTMSYPSNWIARSMISPFILFPN